MVLVCPAVVRRWFAAGCEGGWCQPLAHASRSGQGTTPLPEHDGVRALLLTWMQRLRLWPKSCQEWWATLPGMSSLSKKACTTSTVLSVDPVHWQHNKSVMLPAPQLMLRCWPTRLFGAWGVGASSTAACRCQQLARVHPHLCRTGSSQKARAPKAPSTAELRLLHSWLSC